MNPPDILARIVAKKHLEVDERQRKTPFEKLRAVVDDGPPCRGFVDALVSARSRSAPAVIAELKKASPSEGTIRADFDPPAIARSYAEHGATCLSILTDESFFQGSDDYLRRGREAVDLPVLRKDFTIDPYQVVEARAIGADAILLIVAILTDAELASLGALAAELGLDVLIEVHDEQELESALALSPRIVGINNRDLRNFTTSLDTTTRMLPKIPDDVLVVSESGIKTPDDVAELASVGVPAFLVGTAFMRNPDPGVELARLFNEWKTT